MRHANALAKDSNTSVKIFLMADAVQAARRGQTTPTGYYNLERMLTIPVRQGSQCGACGSCMDARGVTDEDLVFGVRRSSMDELAAWTRDADKVLVY